MSAAPSAAPGVSASAVFSPLLLHTAMLDVMAATLSTPAFVAQRQQHRLQRLLETAHESSLLYRERLGNACPDWQDLARIAPVSRAELMARFDDWVTDPALDLDELRAFTADASRIGQAWRGRYMVWESSGASGLPGVFVQDARAMAVYDALETVRHRPPPRDPASLLGLFSLFDMLGIGDRTALVTATGGHFASAVEFERLRRINPWLASLARNFSLLSPVDELVAQLNDFQPTLVATYPTAAALLADEAEAGRLRIAPRYVLTGGEHLSAAVRARVRAALGAPVRGSYGASEFLPIAWECTHGHLHVNADWVLLEPVDSHYRPVPPGHASHSVLLTNLINFVQPLIRYDLGDKVTLPPGPCRCGSAMPRIDVEGRRDDVLHVPARKPGETVSLLPLALCTLVEAEGVFDFQLQQREPGTLVLRLPLQGEDARQAIERCRRALQQFALSQGARPIRVLGEPGCAVPRGRSGKACRVA